MPGIEFFGNKIPDIANAVPLSRTVIGKSAHSEPAGPPEHLSFTFPSNPWTDWSRRMNAATSPRKTFSCGGIGVMVKPAAGLTAKFCVTGVAAAYEVLPACDA